MYKRQEQASTQPSAQQSSTQQESSSSAATSASQPQASSSQDTTAAAQPTNIDGTYTGKDENDQITLVVTGKTGTWTEVEADGDKEIKQVTFEPENQRVIIGDDVKIYAVNGNQMIIDDLSLIHIWGFGFVCVETSLPQFLFSNRFEKLDGPCHYQ